MYGLGVTPGKRISRAHPTALEFAAATAASDPAAEAAEAAALTSEATADAAFPPHEMSCWQSCRVDVSK